jgi:Tfp pilus assembly protein PilX
VRTPLRRDDRGSALITVIGVTMVLSLLVLASTTYALGAQKTARRDQDWNAALAAAQGGVDEYISRLNADGTYWQYGNSTSNYTKTPASPTAVVAPPASAPNSAFFGWTDLPGSSSRAQFRYEVNTWQYKSDGILHLRSTGRVGKRTRTIDVAVRRQSFIDFLYFTDFETKDPLAYTGSGELSAANAQAQCSKHVYDGRQDIGFGGNCVPINFVSGDVIQGPLHTNDAFLVCGSPQFDGNTSTSWDDPAKKRYRVNTSCGAASPKFARVGDPKLAPTLDVPPSNSAIRREVDKRYTTTPGCLYSGPTSIKLNSNGTMDVDSPWTKDKSVCGTGPGVPLPANGVVYVQNVPKTPTTDPNYWNPADAAIPSKKCVASNPTGSPLSNPIGYPVKGDVTAYGCDTGDVFIEGSLKGKLTVAAENNVVITWNITYQGGAGGTDILGLIANNFVEVYHPFGCPAYKANGTCNSSQTNLNPTGKASTFGDPQISAAILSVNHSFRVQNYASGARLGDLNVTGAIAQRYRGIVGLTGSTGYLKNYVYDTKLKYGSPPKFLDPVKSAFGVTVWSEPSPAFKYNAP